MSLTSKSLAIPIITLLFGIIFAFANTALLVALYGELIELKGERVTDVFN